MSRNSKSIVIIGGGIVGVSTAYHLATHKQFDTNEHSITLIEAGDLAGGASGKAGGFLASWATPQCLAPLSYQLHEDLAAKFDGSSIWGYRKVHAAEVTLRSKATVSSSQATCPQWLNDAYVRDYVEIGTPSDSAQVQPLLLTTTLASAAKELGVDFKRGHVLSMESGVTGTKKVLYRNEGFTSSVDATDVVVAAGPWTTSLLPRIRLMTPKCHSFVIKPSDSVTPNILFLGPDKTDPASRDLESPDDIYPRPSDRMYDFETVYASGHDWYNSPLPSGTNEVMLEEVRLEAIWDAISSMSSQIRSGEILARQACYKAQIRRHEDDEEVGPILGPMEDTPGLWVATGFDEWGIQNGPGAGLVMSEMIFEGEAKSANVATLHPRNFLE